MKKLLALLLALCMMIVPLVSCGDDNGGDGPVLEGDGDIVRDADGNIVYENVKLTMWSVTTGDDAATQDAIVAQFNQMYKGMIEVEVVHYSRYDLETLLGNTMQFDQENAPDLLFNHGSRATEYNDRGWLQEVDFFFEKSGALYDKADFVPSLLESVTIDGTAYGMPIDCHSAVLCIRVDILEKNGLKIPTTYAELVEVCDQAAELAANNNLWIRGENSQVRVVPSQHSSPMNNQLVPGLNIHGIVTGQHKGLLVACRLSAGLHGPVRTPIDPAGDILPHLFPALFGQVPLHGLHHSVNVHCVGVPVCIIHGPPQIARVPDMPISFARFASS
jgi:hypothetical protein